MIHVNPCGDVGVVTLWSLTNKVHEHLGQIGIDLGKETSRVAVIANLYGDGLPHMLRNLLWNPQIRYLLVVGNDLSGSSDWLSNFFANGLEEVERLGAKMYRIRGANTERTIDGLVRPEHFVHKPEVVLHVGKTTDAAVQEGIRTFFGRLPAIEECAINRAKPPEIPEPEVTRYPAVAFAQTVVEDTPLQAWCRLVARLHRFGHRNFVAKAHGTDSEERIELLDLKAVIMEPQVEDEAVLAEYGFSLSGFIEYQRRILDPILLESQEYTYGWLLRGYFVDEDGNTVDSLEVIAQRLRQSLHSRHGYTSLWDSRKHLPDGTGCPCFVSAFFRFFDGKLHLSATFRTHNIMSAWLENVYGLMAILKYVADAVGVPPGPITVHSLSASINPNALEQAKLIAERMTTSDVIDPATGKTSLRLDPNGQFTITIDTETGEIVATHSFEGMKLTEYRGRTAAIVERKISADEAISDVSHALYVGRELAKAEAQLRAKKS